MPRRFSTTTAEQVIATVEAVIVNPNPTTAAFVAEFADLPTAARATAALEMAEDLGFLQKSGAAWVNLSMLSRLVSTFGQKQKSAVLRIVLESFEPFLVFRQRLVDTGDAIAAARQTKAALDLDAHPEEIKDTLVSLGSYAQALVGSGGGQYAPVDQAFLTPLTDLAGACADLAAADARVRQLVGGQALAVASQADVIDPLANAMLHAAHGDPRGAVQEAGNAIESFLSASSAGAGVNVAGAPGINAKVQRFVAAGRFPAKIAGVGYYLGHIRNAADHGVDPEVGAPWNIRGATGVEYVHVACSFVAVAVRRLAGDPPDV
jgi:hypothetical protein